MKRQRTFSRKKGKRSEYASLTSILTPRLWQPVQRTRPDLEKKLQEFLPNEVTFSDEDKLYLEGIERILRTCDSVHWKAESIGHIIECLLDNPKVKAESVELWVRRHERDDYEAVCDCIRLAPPDTVRILQRLPRRGSQKIVFEASWGLRQRTVILKQLLSVDVTLAREMLSHPLANEHPNIIRTYSLRNSRNDVFLVEEKLHTVLHDGWRSGGTEQTALLLHDIASALAYLDRQQLVHGDVKPDNIGFEQDRFILLDFGVCRPVKEFTDSTSATGSLRTRAPELFADPRKQSWRSDVWALGATVVCAHCGHFPLIDPNETIPRISDPESRAVFEELLVKRISSEYETRIADALSAVSEERLRRVLEQMLQREEKDRPPPEDIVETIRSQLPHAAPDSTLAGTSIVSADYEIKAIVALWPDRDAVKKLPPGRKTSLEKRLHELRERVHEEPTLLAKVDALLPVS